MEKRSPGMGVEQKLGNMGVVTTTLENGQLVAHECDVAHAVRSGLLRHRDDVRAGGTLMT
jgi:hypothetical protein